MKILIDGDACSKIPVIEDIARKNRIPCHIYCDTSRFMESDYSTVHVVDVGTNSADFAITNSCEKNDIVVTNDTGLAAMILTQHAYVMNSQGLEYTDRNIMPMLNARHMRQSVIRKTGRKQVKGQMYINQEHGSFASTLYRLLRKESGMS